MKTTKIVFYVSTDLLTLMMLFSAGMYIFDNAEVSKLFSALGYQSSIVYPLAVSKLLGLVAISSGYSARLKERAYAGFFF
ncbi:MAG: DoxX family protein [Acidobacteriota bacterium]|nr:DoxX family protein [Acidobacteriota bacterium]